MTNRNRCGTTALTLALVLFALLSAASGLAGGGPEGVAVIVNSDSFDSLAVANAFISLREIPACNVIYLSGLPAADEEITIEDFREKILKPVLQILQQKGLAAQIDAIVYSAGFPTKVNFQGDVEKIKLPPQITPGASLTGLTYLYQGALNKAPQYYLDPRSNWCVRRAIPKLQDQAPWTEGEQKQFLDIQQRLGERMKQLAEKYQAWKGQLEAEGRQPEPGASPPQSEAERAADAMFWQELDGLIGQLLAAHPNSGNLLYLRAGCRMIAGSAEEALQLLAKACECGWWNAGQLAGDPVWKPLAERDDFKAVVASMKDPEFTVPQPKCFRGNITWDQAGQEVAPDKGRRYILSSMLAVTGGRGTSKDAALAVLKRSAEADGTCPKGTFYLMRSEDIRSSCRDWAFGSTAAALERLGMKAAIANGVLPENKADVIGLVTGAEKFDWPACGSAIMRGAFCDNLTSFGGVLRAGATQTPLSEFLKHGAAASSGTVAEPLALQDKFPLAYIQFFYASGCSLGEAFYQSVSGPYQILLVGDPLCQPWAKAPRVSPLPASLGKPIKGVLAFKPKASAPPGMKIGRIEAFLNGRRCAIIKEGEEISIDTTKIDDGSHELRVVAITEGDLQIQGRLVKRISIANKNRAYAVKPPKKSSFSANDSFDVSVRCEGAIAHLLLHNERQIAVANGPQAMLSAATRAIGQGEVLLQPVAIFDQEGKQKLWGEPFKVRIRP